MDYLIYANRKYKKPQRHGQVFDYQLGRVHDYIKINMIYFNRDMS